MPEAVIVSAARSPIGRANKGSLEGLPSRRPDRADRPGGAGQGPRARPARPIDDLLLGCGLPGGETGNNMARVVTVLLGMDDVPGATHHPLLLLVGADHADGLPRDQGRRGRRRSSPPASRPSPASPRAPPTTSPTPATRSSPTRRRAPRSYAAGRPGLARPARGRRSCPTSTSRWARPPRTSPGCAASTARSSTSSRVRSQNLAEKAIDDGFWAREITPVTHARRHGRRRRTTARAPASPTTPSPASSRCSAPTAWSPPATAARSTTAPPRS